MSNESTIKKYSDKDLEYFRQLILDKKQEAEQEIDRLQSRLTGTGTDQLDEDSGYALHIADSASVSTGRENIYILIDRQKKLIGYLDRALLRIDNKTYGICRVTGELIPKERLEAIPHTQLSIEGKMKEQRGY